MDKYMQLALNKAKKGFLNNEGGPFGAVIVDDEGNVISTGNNQVIKNNDPTAHAEIQAIRKACDKLSSYDLSGYNIYTSCEPCPMCLSAIIWSNIRHIFYGATRDDAGKIGFRDDKIYNYLNGNNEIDLEIKQIDYEQCSILFNEYSKNNGIIY